jgi:hypothetical protein
LPKIDGAWAYCSKSWLKFQDRPGLHHTQRATFDWYQEIQEGFRGVQGAEPLVRQKAVQIDKRRLVLQVNGLITAIHAINQEEESADHNTPVKMNDCVDSYIHELNKTSFNSSEIQNKVARKRSKYHRETPIQEISQPSYIISKDRDVPMPITTEDKKDAKELFQRLIES